MTKKIKRQSEEVKALADTLLGIPDTRDMKYFIHEISDLYEGEEYLHHIQRQFGDVLPTELVEELEEFFEAQNVMAEQAAEILWELAEWELHKRGIDTSDDGVRAVFDRWQSASGPQDMEVR